MQKTASITHSIAIMVLLSGCPPGPSPSDDATTGDGLGVGLIGNGLVDPFPSTLLLDATGHIDIPTADIPIPEGGSLADVSRLRWRDGFSVAQVAITRLKIKDESGFPHWSVEDDGSGSVKLADLTDGVFLPCFAELDANSATGDVPTLIVRPQVALPVGHDVVVVVTTDAADRTAEFEALLNGAPHESVVDQAAHFQELIDDLGALGVAAADVALAWDFPISDGRAPLQSALEQLSTPTVWTIAEIREDDNVPYRTYRAADGTFEVMDFVGADDLLELNADGSVEAGSGVTEAALYVHIPDSVRDAPAGSVPVLVFGHGFLSHPENYLDDDDDPSAVISLADEGGFIVVGTLWRGLSQPDAGFALGVAADFGKFPTLADRMVQGMVNASALVKLVTEGELLTDPIFQGESGQSLADPNTLLYYGISLGGIEGSVLVAQGHPFQAAVLHVPGAQWSTMLERSSNWTTFELALVPSIDDPHDRQLLYAVSQLWWDPVEPMSWVPEIAASPILIQESYGDEQVPNMTTRALGRSVQFDVLSPGVEAPWGTGVAAGPFPEGSTGYVQFDPELARPPDANRPAPITGAHGAPRLWEQTQRQTLAFLQRPGLVTDPCDGPCTASNTDPAVED